MKYVFSGFLAVGMSLACQQAYCEPLILKSCEVGMVYQSSSAQCLMQIENTDHHHSLSIKIGPLSADSTIERATLQVEPGATKSIRASADTSEVLGNFARYFEVTVAGQEKPQILALKGFAYSLVNGTEAPVDMGVVDLHLPLEKRVVELSSQDFPGFKISKITSAPTFLNATVEKDGTALGFVAKQDAPWGKSEGFVKFEINSPQQKAATLKVNVDIHGDVIWSIPLADFGVIRTGDPAEMIVVLDGYAGKSFGIPNITTSGEKISAKLEACRENKKSCTNLRLKLPASDVKGVFSGKVLMEFPSLSKSAELNFRGLRVARSAQIRDLNKPEVSQQPLVQPKFIDQLNTAIAQSATAAESKVDVPKESSEASVPSGTGPLLRWQVAHESNIYGYLIYRCEQRDAGCTRVNQDIVKVHAGGENSKYAWRDTTALVGSKYWYFISTLHMNGKKERLSDPVEVTAKAK
jgi:hypothetical protein